jgi:tetratricopeptide (TPR) repeat protein
MRSRQLVTRLLLLGALSTSALARPASAATPPLPVACTSVSPGESDSAHVRYQAGKEYYDEANYDAAITQFREAYKKDCTKHDLLIIISRAYELKGDRAAAIEALEEYLKRVPGSRDAPQHRTRVENLRKQVELAQVATAPPAPASPAITPPPPEVREHTVPPWVVAGVGFAGAVTGLVVILTAPSLPTGCNAASGQCTSIPGETSTQYEERRSQAGASQTQPTVGAVVLGVGGAVLVGGLLWHFLEPTGPVARVGGRPPRLQPQAAPGFAGLSLGGSF